MAVKKGQTPAPSSEEEQIKLIDEAKKKVNVEAFYMKRCLDNSKLMDALKHASNMISQLRTGLLSPKNYYALYIFAFDQLRHLESYLYEEKQKGEKMSKLYELVQYAGNILPRLYLLVTVGSIYIKSKEAPAKDVLKDLVEMCRGVQHPTRGLFLRNYLSEMTKDKLPDIGSEYEGVGGNVDDSIDFILQNFTEMNKLWVRMQHQGPVRAREKREAERQELRLLVGKNLARLSQLEGVDLDKYSQVVLPRILEQVVNCKDVIAQQYLMECVIQVFPDEFHLQTLERFLTTVEQLQGDVDVTAVISSLIERLSNYARQSSNLLPSNVAVFEIFFKHSTALIDQRDQMGVESVLALLVALLNLSLTCYSDNYGYVDQVFAKAANCLQSYKDNEVAINSPKAVKELVKLLKTPLDTYRNILTLLGLENFSRLIPFLAYDLRKKVSIDFVRNAIDNETPITEVDQVTKLLTFISPLVVDEDDQPDMEDVDMDDFAEEQCWVASLIHLLTHDNPEQLFMMYVTARKHFGQGGMRIKYTLAPLVFGAFAVARRIRQKGKAGGDEDWVRKCKKIFKFVHETITALAKHQEAHLAFGLFLQAAQAASHAGFETIAYEFITQAFIIYEGEFSDSLDQKRAITLITATLQTLACFSEENYDTLITKTALHSSKLLKKADQCEAVCLCSHLFWCNNEEKPYKDGKRVLECLQKSLKIANSCMDTTVNVHLFVAILNKYLYFYQEQNEAITPKYLKSLIALINTNIANMESPDDNLTAYYQSTLGYYKQLAASSED